MEVLIPPHPALFTYDILELIFARLDLRTLLTSAQRTCRVWSNLIQSSPAIQKVLFFKPVLNHPSREKILNPLLAEVFPSIFQQHEAIRQHPDQPFTKFTFTSFDMVKRHRKWRLYFRPEASWRRMLVQQPPAYSLARFQCLYDGPHIHNSYLEIPAHIYLQNGLRMETLFDVFFFVDPSNYEQDTQVVWGSNYRFSTQDIPYELQRAGIFRDTDILVYRRTYSSRRHEPYSPDQYVVDNIRDIYQKLNLHSKFHETGWDMRYALSWYTWMT